MIEEKCEHAFFYVLISGEEKVQRRFLKETLKNKPFRQEERLLGVGYIQICIFKVNN